MPFCTKCGNMAEEGDKFCTKCATELKMGKSNTGATIGIKYHEEIAKKISSFKSVNSVLDKRSINEIHKFVESGEDIISAASVYHKSNQGILVISSSRIFFVSKTLGKKPIFDEIKYDSILGLEFKKGMLSGDIIIELPSEKVKFKSKASGDEFHSLVFSELLKHIESRGLTEKISIVDKFASKNPRLEEIKSQFSHMSGMDKFLARGEIKELTKILWEDEKVEHAIEGSYHQGRGLLIATNKRLIFVDKGFIYGLKVEDFPYDKITSIQYKTGLMWGEITIFASGNKAVITETWKKETQNFSEYVRARISSVKEHASHKEILMQNDGSPVYGDEDLLNKIKKLAELKEQGILTQEEFETKKKELLSRM